MTIPGGETMDLTGGVAGCYFGAHPAVVTDVADPDGQGRVRVRLPWSPDSGGSAYQAWARLATLMAGSGRGSWFVPDVDDEVLVLFEGGDPRRPYVVGSLWNGVDSPPESMDAAGANHLKVLRSRNGVTITLDDHDGREKLTLSTPGGQSVVLEDGPGKITVRDSNGNSVELGAGGIRLTSGATVTVEASELKVTAGMVTVDAGMSKFSGAVKADAAVITNSVVGASYTPGAGNIW
ncbi:MAG: type IV secretion protein Rhs [Rhodococcus sp. (in: high G+C Gram-positive bacteria)]|nr:MAG: type IV secretion protein Rhs [Rhodococcus sp. (in: high G+C Gram-positive bacteria)]